MELKGGGGKRSVCLFYYLVFTVQDTNSFLLMKVNKELEETHTFCCRLKVVSALINYTCSTKEKKKGEGIKEDVMTAEEKGVVYLKKRRLQIKCSQ
jgi:hypothetical protein